MGKAEDLRLSLSRDMTKMTNMVSSYGKSIKSSLQRLRRDNTNDHTPVASPSEGGAPTSDYFRMESGSTSNPAQLLLSSTCHRDGAPAVGAAGAASRHPPASSQGSTIACHVCSTHMIWPADLPQVCSLAADRQSVPFPCLFLSTARARQGSRSPHSGAGGDRRGAQAVVLSTIPHTECGQRRRRLHRTRCVAPVQVCAREIAKGRA